MTRATVDTAAGPPARPGALARGFACVVFGLGVAMLAFAAICLGFFIFLMCCPGGTGDGPGLGRIAAWFGLILGLGVGYPLSWLGRRLPGTPARLRPRPDDGIPSSARR